MSFLAVDKQKFLFQGQQHNFPFVRRTETDAAQEVIELRKSEEKIEEQINF